MTNKYGLDTSYFKKNLERILREIDCYTPSEMQRALARLSDVARVKCKESVMEHNSLPKCCCGDDGRYQNMRHGMFIWTCGKHGCLQERPTTTAANTR